MFTWGPVKRSVSLQTNLGFTGGTPGAAPTVLSNGDKTATWSPTTSQWGAAWVRKGSARTGKYYWEISNDGPTFVIVAAGFMGQSAWIAPTSEYPRNPYAEPSYFAVSAGVFSVSTGLVTNGTSSSNAAYFWGNSGDVLGIAVDFDTGKVWYRINGAAWISGDPVAGTSPSHTLPSGEFDPYVTMYNTNTTLQLTARFDPSEYGTSAPSGFGYFSD